MKQRRQEHTSGLPVAAAEVRAEHVEIVQVVHVGGGPGWMPHWNDTWLIAPPRCGRFLVCQQEYGVCSGPNRGRCGPLADPMQDGPGQKTEDAPQRDAHEHANRDPKQRQCVFLTIGQN